MMVKQGERYRMFDIENNQYITVEALDTNGSLVYVENQETGVTDWVSRQELEE